MKVARGRVGIRCDHIWLSDPESISGSTALSTIFKKGNLH